MMRVEERALSFDAGPRMGHLDHPFSAHAAERPKVSDKKSRSLVGYLMLASNSLIQSSYSVRDDWPTHGNPPPSPALQDDSIAQ
jgi:hypothetical protein